MQSLRSDGDAGQVSVEKRRKELGVEQHLLGKELAEGSTTWAPKRRKVRERLKEHMVPI